MYKTILFPKELLEIIEEALFLWVDAVAAELAELAQEFLLAGAEVLRREDFDDNVLVAAAGAAQVRDAASLEAQDLAALRAGGDFHVDGAVERRHLDGAAEGRLDEGDRNLDDDVGALPLEEFMRLDEDIDVEVAVAAAVRARLAMARYAQARALVDALRDRDLDGVRLARLARAVAMGARGLDDLARAAAAAAGRLVHHAAERRVVHGLAHAGAVAVGAGLLARAGRRACAVAMGALRRARDGELDLLAERRLLEGNLEVVAQVGAALRHGALAAAAASAAAEEHVEDVSEAIGTAAKAAEATLTEAAEAAAALEAARAVKGPRAELIVLRALLRILEDLVGRVDFLEFLLGFLFVAAVEIRMIFAGQFLVCFLDLCVRGILADAQDLI